MANTPRNPLGESARPALALVTSPPETNSPDVVAALATIRPPPIGNPNVVRDAKGRITRGQSLNPTGARTSLPALMRRVVEANGGFEAATQVLVDIAWGKLAPGARLADRMRAIELLYDRVHGKAREHVTLDNNDGKGAAQLRGRSLDELIGMRTKLRALRGGDLEPQEAEVIDDK